MASNDTPNKGPACLENCSKCLSDDRPIVNKPAVIERDGENERGDAGIVGAKNNDNQTPIKTINGKFFMVNGANISCACVRSPNGFSKYCHLGDGFIDLVLVRHTSFINNIRFLLAMSSQNSNIVC